MQPSPDFRLYAAYSAILGYLYLGLIVGAVIEWGTRTENEQKTETDDEMIATRSVAQTLSSLEGHLNRIKNQADAETELVRTRRNLDMLRAQYNELRDKIRSGGSLLR